MSEDQERYDENEEQHPESTPAISDAAMELPEIPQDAMKMGSTLSEEPVSRINTGSAKRSGWKIFAASVALVAVGASMGSATTWYMARKFVPVPSTAMTIPESPGAKRVAQAFIDSGNVIPSIYRQVGPSVVSITVQVNQGWTRGKATGSGFVVDPKGYILTNNHVIENASKISVSFVDGTVLDGTVVGKDKYKDLAVVKVEVGNHALVAAPLGDSDQVQVGELAIAIGSPFSQDYSVTAGIVSGLNRELHEESSSWVIPGAIQTDAAINPGNSGGPLLNSSGQVIGINTAIESPTRGSVGIGFAVPINVAREILPTLIAGNKVQYAWLGVGLNDLTSAIAEQAGIDVTEGALVVDVYADSPAAKAGLKPAGLTRRGEIASADVVIEVDGKPVKKADDFVKYLSTKKPDDTIKMIVVRGSKRLTITATLVPRPDQLPDLNE